MHVGTSKVLSFICFTLLLCSGILYHLPLLGDPRHLNPSLGDLFEKRVDYSWGFIPPGKELLGLPYWKDLLGFLGWKRICLVNHPHW